jgi:hypothetical protein
VRKRKANNYFKVDFIFIEINNQPTKSDKNIEIFGAYFLASEEEQEKAIKDLLEELKVLEEQGPGDKTFFGGNTIKYD